MIEGKFVEGAGGGEAAGVGGYDLEVREGGVLKWRRKDISNFRNGWLEAQLMRHIPQRNRKERTRDYQGFLLTALTLLNNSPANNTFASLLVPYLVNPKSCSSPTLSCGGLTNSSISSVIFAWYFIISFFPWAVEPNQTIRAPAADAGALLILCRRSRVRSEFPR